jgi:hypothetical protein
VQVGQFTEYGLHVILLPGWRSDSGSHEIELNGLGLSVPYRSIAIKRGFG